MKSARLVVWLWIVIALVACSDRAWALEESRAILLHNAATATGAGTELNVSSFSTVALQVTISATATVTFQGTVDGTNWGSVGCSQLGGTAGTVATATATGTYQCNVAGLSLFRANITSYGSGTVTVYARTTTAMLGGGGVFGFLFDTLGNLKVLLGGLLSGEIQASTQAESYLQVRPLRKYTYAASGTFTPAATATDILTITGSATKTITVLSIILTTTNTAAGSQQFLTIKRSAADTGGTPVAATLVPLDSANAAATATVNHYTANPAGLGAAVGTINTLRVASPVAVPGSFAGVAETAGKELLPLVASPNGLVAQPVTLRGTAEQLAVNFAGAALVAGQTHAYTILFTEE